MSPPERLYQRNDQTAGAPYPLSEYIRRFLWEFVQSSLIRWSPKRAHGWRRFWLRMFGARLTGTSFTKASTTVRHPWLLEMGEWSTLAEDVEIYNLGWIRIGSHTTVSQRAWLCAGTHDYTKIDLPLIRPSIVVGDGVWVCAGAFIGPGVTVGHNAIVGACAVVMRDVPEAAIVAGNPAKVVRERPRPEQK
ncbi:MAG: putative colanic acid biosynthesis acetyltransferase [Phycisphaerales bacterium]|nr:putative colanic acid biosynthesis acetyltransferase [Phycisphaerales bacterium]